MRVGLLDKEFQRMSCANSDLVASISEANMEYFDYENLGEAKCKETVSWVKAHTLVKLQMEQNNTNEKTKTWYERTLPQQIKNVSNEAIYQLWLGMREVLSLYPQRAR